MKFSELKAPICLYAGDIMDHNRLTITGLNFVGLSLTRNDHMHIQHNLLHKHDLPDNSVSVYQAEDVMEHIDLDKLVDVFNDIYRILEPGGLFRLSIPDYRCDVLKNRSICDDQGNIIFDPNGGGTYDEVNKTVIDGGHVWFPKYEIVKELLDKTHFTNVDFLHYHKNDESFVLKVVDYSLGYISRTPDHDDRVKNPKQPMSIIVDCYK